MDEYIKRIDANYAVTDAIWHGKRSMHDVASAINSVLSADVAPVRHGRWIDKGEYAVCTECGGRSGTQYDGVEPIPLMTQFCPNCGCHMDGGDDE